MEEVFAEAGWVEAAAVAGTIENAHPADSHCASGPAAAKGWSVVPTQTMNFVRRDRRCPPHA
jgi:hypothetical protein